jgi:hypothetical protein
MSKNKVMLTFKIEAEERAFWESNDSSGSRDSSEYVNWKQAQQVSMPNLKPSTKTISLRLTEGLLDSIKVWLSDDVKQSHKRK